MKNKSAWGYHLMLDCSSCNDNIKNKKAIELFIKDLLRTIKMIPHGKPLIEYLLPTQKSRLQYDSVDQDIKHICTFYGS